MKKYIIFLMLSFSIFVYSMEISIDTNKSIEKQESENKSLIAKMIELQTDEYLKKKGEWARYAEPVVINTLNFSHKMIKNLKLYAQVRDSSDLQFFMRHDIHTFPELHTLTMIDLSNNFLEELPEELKELQHIETCDVSDNKLQDISVVRHWKKTLCILKVANNQISSIERIGDEPLSNFMKLQWMNIVQNPITDLPCEEIYELYQEQKASGRGLWICIDRKYELSEDLAQIADDIFLKIDVAKIEN